MIMVEVEVMTVNMIVIGVKKLMNIYVCTGDLKALCGNVDALGLKG